MRIFSAVLIIEHDEYFLKYFEEIEEFFYSDFDNVGDFDRKILIFNRHHIFKTPLFDDEFYGK